jgi:hypothetical protein
MRTIQSGGGDCVHQLDPTDALRKHPDDRGHHMPRTKTPCVVPPRHRITDVFCSCTYIWLEAGGFRFPIHDKDQRIGGPDTRYLQSISRLSPSVSFPEQTSLSSTNTSPTRNTFRNFITATAITAAIRICCYARPFNVGTIRRYCCSKCPKPPSDKYRTSNSRNRGTTYVLWAWFNL